MDTRNIIVPCIDNGGYRQFGWYNPKVAIKDRLYHVGSDRNCNAGSYVYHPLNGTVIFSDEVSGFGSYNKKGGVTIIKSLFKGEWYSILYGHIIRELEIGEFVDKDQSIGVVIRYYTKDFRADHLHWGVWKGGGIPKGNWGYVKDMDNWINPNTFLTTIMNERNKGV